MMMTMNCFCGMVERHLTLFSAETIVRDPHHRESPTRREQSHYLKSLPGYFSPTRLTEKI